MCNQGIRVFTEIFREYTYSLITHIHCNIYIDQLLKVLSNSGFGCYIGKEFYGCMGYADDIVILARTLLSTCRTSIIRTPWETYNPVG